MKVVAGNGTQYGDPGEQMIDSVASVTPKVLAKE